MPGGFRLDYSRLGIDSVLLSDEQAAIVRMLDEILLPKRYQVGNLRADDEASMAKWRRKANDVQHLTAHLIAGHDAFVTSNDDDLLKKRPSSGPEPGSSSSTRSRPSRWPTAKPPEPTQRRGVAAHHSWYRTPTRPSSSPSSTA